MTTARIQPRFPTTVERIVARLNALSFDELVDFGAWSALDGLSSATVFEVVDADPDSVILRSDATFEAQASIYVTLTFGQGGDADTMSDEYPATVIGRVDEYAVTITGLEVDTSSFYE